MAAILSVNYLRPVNFDSGRSTRPAGRSASGHKRPTGVPDTCLRLRIGSRPSRELATGPVTDQAEVEGNDTGFVRQPPGPSFMM